ncbi:hypothetical protein NXS08_05050 [Gleimia sp. 6138-11-ORH1]|uniref:hypothetical protein n=1 Tax=Gleimia sp. 6138-11-ORH1 TaxID=2973937 RepID=UPI002167913B|nr:hypothetical protein [Gleimia sp. 6138-11-ORH1]MCS4484844.1 hypothetical protein [Gleimia sp. 6138-11-ORH1]
MPTNPKPANEKPKMQPFYFLLAILLFVAIALGVSVWNWGKNLNYWGTPASLQTLLDEKVAQPNNFGITVKSFSHTENVPLFGKTPPYEVKYVFSDDAAKSAAESVKNQALTDGWVADPSCPSKRYWCANKTPAGKPTLRLTITPLTAESTESSTFTFQVSISYY